MSADRLIKLRYIFLSRKLRAECDAINIKLADHPDINDLQRLHSKIKKTDRKWLDEYLKYKG